jgi:hypothetical protein
MADRGLTAPVEQGAAQVVGDTLGMLGPAIGTQFAPQIAGALNRGAANLAAPRTMGKQSGAIVWHGSPHKFDRFDSSKIGTGEGAQSYGHGLYLAEAPEAAGEYARMNLTGPANVAHVAKKRGPDAAMDSLQMVYPGMPKAWYESAIQKADEAGNLYKVDLPDEQIARMLNYETNLADQAPELLDVIAPAYQRSLQSATTSFSWAQPEISPSVARDMAKGISGQKAYDLLKQQHGAEGAAKILKEAGIPGIRYLDGVSRGTGAGTSNFVVFPGNESILRILERNGQPLGLMGVR